MRMAPATPLCRACHGDATKVLQHHISSPIRGRGNVPVLPQEAAAPRGALRCQGRAPRAKSSPAPTPLCPLSPCRVQFLPQMGPSARGPALHPPGAFQAPPSQPKTVSSYASKGIFSIQPPPPASPCPRRAVAEEGWSRRDQLVVWGARGEPPSACAGAAWALGRAAGSGTRRRRPSGERPGVSGAARGTDARSG